MNNKLTHFILCFLITFILLSGCMTKPVISNEKVTESMTIVPPKPAAPNANKATQRDVSIYIIQLRSWGNQMAAQLDAIGKLIKDDGKEKETK